MMPARRRAVAVGVLLAMGMVSAQDRPNFSGEWLLVEPPQNPPTVVEVKQDADSIVINGVRYPFSGELVARTGPRAYSSTTATWRGDSLVIASVMWFYSADGGPRKFTDFWAEDVRFFDAQGRWVSLDTDLSAGGERTTTRFVYQKKR
jgi:hypothetical protein